MRYKIEERGNGKFYLYRKRFLRWEVVSDSFNRSGDKMRYSWGEWSSPYGSAFKHPFDTYDEAHNLLTEYLLNEEKRRAAKVRAKTVVDSKEIEVCYE